MIQLCESSQSGAKIVNKSVFPCEFVQQSIDLATGHTIHRLGWFRRIELNSYPKHGQEQTAAAMEVPSFAAKA